MLLLQSNSYPHHFTHNNKTLKACDILYLVKSARPSSVRCIEVGWKSSRDCRLCVCKGEKEEVERGKENEEKGKGEKEEKKKEEKEEESEGKEEKKEEDEKEVGGLG